MTETHKKILLGLLVVVLGCTAAFIVALLWKPDNLNEALPPKYVIKEAPKPVETTLFFGGDIMLSRNVGTKIVEANDPTLPFHKITEIVKNSTLSFANLESPFLDKGSRVTEGLVFKAEPNAIEGMKAAGIDIVSTANNHAFDQGKAGLAYTSDWLSQNGISSVGTGLDCHSGVIKEANGIKFGFLAYSYTAYNDGGRSKDPLICDWNDSEKIAEDIQALRLKADFVIVSSHMGAEYQRTPSPDNETAARAAIDSGADLFIGHHPHWVQTMEEYKGKFIFYSLGNFVFDQMWSQDTREGLAVQVLFKDKKLDRITLMPMVIDNFCCPRWADEEETKNILSKINLTSNVLIPKNEGVN